MITMKPIFLSLLLTQIITASAFCIVKRSKVVLHQRGLRCKRSNCEGQEDHPRTLRRTKAEEHKTDDNVSSTTLNRRDVLMRMGIASFSAVTTGLTMVPSSSSAGEIGAKITKAVTQSDLGISVRTSVVRGAQVIDQLDGKWERFSDDYQLGAERNRVGGRPKPKNIPDPLPLDIGFATKILDTTDSTFLSLTGIGAPKLKEQIDKVFSLTRRSFERSGLSLNDIASFENGAQFDYVSYVHYKAYCDLIMEQKIPFGSFRSTFEKQAGESILKIFLPDYKQPKQSFAKSSTSSMQMELKTRFATSLSAMKEVCQILVEKGFVGSTEFSKIEDDDIDDWSDDSSELELTVALDGDITISSQTLLQEQGFRLYPNFGRYAIAELLRQQLQPTGQKVTVEDYYFDTDYNSDPDKFDVKEVLLNIVIDSEA